jgi:hypothetical protein
VSETYSAKPFISHDGIDEAGVRAEVRVVTGLGEIDSINPSGNGKAASVKFKVSNTKYTPSGYAPVDSNVMKKIEEAQAGGEPIHFRIETRRKDHIPRTTPIDEVAPPRDMNAARDNIFKSLVAVKLQDETEWTISPHARTRIDEDPRTGGAHSAYDHSLDELKGGSSQPGMTLQAAPKNGFEPAPFITLLPSGEVNPGSMAVSVPLNLYSFIVEYERDHSDALDLEDKQRVLVARVLLSAANALQLGIYAETSKPMERPDLSAGSHTRARALLFEGVRTFFPLTNEIVDDKEKLKEWKDALVEKGLAMWKWSIKEVNALLA